MIVELFGPPAVGKTTCAFRLAGALRARPPRGPADESPASRAAGRPAARSKASSRAAPASPDAPPGRDLRHAAQHREHVAAAWHLLATMPPRSPPSCIRLYRYLLHLHCAWEAAALAPYLVVIDQGFVQAVASLVLLSGCRNEVRIERELANLPRPDLLVGLQSLPLCCAIVSQLGLVVYAERSAICAGGLIAVLGLAAIVASGHAARHGMTLTFAAGFGLVPVYALLWIRCARVRAFGGVAAALIPDRVVRDGFVLAAILLAALLSAGAGRHHRTCHGHPGGSQSADTDGRAG